MSPADREPLPPVRVSLYGAGQVNTSVASILDSRQAVELHGPWGREERRRALEAGADVVIIATTSFLSEVAPDIRTAVSAGANVITTAEEAAYPAAVDPAISAELDSLARERAVTILGAGLNPGFAFDALVVTATGAASRVDSLRVERVVDLSGFGRTVLRRIGIGYTAEEFAAGVQSGAITGHIGFPQSMRVVAGCLGLSLERIERHIAPILADQEHVAGDLTISAGQTAGFEQHYLATVEGRTWFEACFLGHLDPTGHGTPPRDAIHLEGDAPLHLEIAPGLNPQTATPAIVANSVRRVIDAPAGWLTVADLPPAHPD